MKLTIILAILVIFWAVVVEPNILVIKHLEIEDANLKGLKIVFASDFHIKKYEMYRLKRVVKTINEQNPDIILLGGDYVNGHRKKSSMPIEKISKEFSNFKSKYGTYAVIGNHDGWQGKIEIIKALEKNNVKVFMNNNVCFDKFCIAGVDDLQTGTVDINKALKGVNKPVILLSHTPDIMPDVPFNVNLTLAGHLHGGQIRFGRALIVPSKFGTKYANGYLKEKNGKKIYTSKGLGTSILAMRFSCFPEIVVIEFK